MQAGDPGLEVTVAWHAYQQLRSIFYAATPVAGRGIAERVLDSFQCCPIPEIARLGRTLRSWRVEVLAYFDTGGISNGGTEAINLIIEKARRLAHGSETSATTQSAACWPRAELVHGGDDGAGQGELPTLQSEEPSSHCYTLDR